MAVREKPTETDTGWAWVILFGSVIWNFIIGGTFRVYGIFFIEFQEIFNSSPSETGLLGLVCGIASIIISPISGRMSDKYSVRMMALVGSLGATAGVFLTAFAPNLLAAIFTFGVIFGVSVGFMDCPVLGMVAKYFKRHLNLANGISFAGCSLGNLVLGHVMAFSIDAYTMRGALIVLAGFWMHMCVVATLMRPFVPPDTAEQDGKAGQPRQSHATSVVEEAGIHEFRVSAASSTTSVVEDAAEKRYSRISEEAVAIMRNSQVPEDGGCSDKDRQLEPQNDTTDLTHTSPQNDAVITNDEPATTPIKRIMPKGDSICRDDGNEMLATEGVADATDNLPHNEIPLLEKDADHCTEMTAEKVAGGSGCQKIKQYLRDSEYLRFLRNRRLISMLILLGCGYNSFYTLLVGFPAYMLEVGLTLHDVAWFMFVLGLVEIPMRVIIPAIVDRFQISAVIPLVASYCIMGVAGLLTTFVPHFYVFIAYACTHGTFGGLSVIFTASLMRDCVDIREIGSAIGLASMQLHVAISLSSTVIGVMQQLTGYYINAIRLSSSLFFFGVFVYIIIYFAGLNEPRRTNKDIGNSTELVV